MDSTLASLLLDFTGLSDQEAEEAVFDKYVELYLDSGRAPRRIGVSKTHDGSDCLFTESRFDHAFFSKGFYSKERFDRIRGARVAWIGWLIAGKLEHTECWLVPPKEASRRVQTRPCNRLYLLRKESFVVWLEPGSQNYARNATNKPTWWFSSAYLAGYGDIRRYCRAGTLVWTQKNIP